MPKTLIIGVLLLLAACGGDNGPPFQVEAIELTAPMPGRSMSAGYMILTNNSDEEIVVTQVTSSGHRDVQIHESRVDHGVARMRRIAALAIPAQSSVELQRGGLHLMLMQAYGENTSVLLTFYAGDHVIASVETNIKNRSAD